MNPLLACAGHWTGTSTLYLPDVPPDSSASTLTITPLLGNRFIRLDYDWACRDKPQEGSLLIAGDAACWIDTWHMSDKMWVCTHDNPGIFRGSFAVPPGPDWHWLIEVLPQSDGTLRMTMFNISPDGKSEDLAVEAEYRRTY